jgi:dipeptidyl aminopeptidase/acylaminoacyl peptidase
MVVFRLCISIVAIAIPAAVSAQTAKDLPKLSRVEVKSSLDNEPQPVLFWAPDKAQEERTPLFVFLHSWSGDYRQDNAKWHTQAVKRGWIYIHPNFRGVNQTPKACGSKWARQDILDAVDFATEKFNVDPKRIYLAGTSGGGHMAMLMAGHHPDRFSAVSAWVGISDLSSWFAFHLKDGKPQRYAQMILASLGGAPGSSSLIDADYKDRSPIYHLHRTGDLPFLMSAGIDDGHTGSVPIVHSLSAFNAIAKAQNAEVIADAEIARLSNRRNLVALPRSKSEKLPPFGRGIVFARNAGPASVVIFEGGHEGLPAPACEWLALQSRAVQMAQ